MLVSKNWFYYTVTIGSISIINKCKRKTRSAVITRSENDACNTPLLVDDKRANEEEKKKRVSSFHSFGVLLFFFFFPFYRSLFLFLRFNIFSNSRQDAWHQKRHVSTFSTDVFLSYRRDIYIFFLPYNVRNGNVSTEEKKKWCSDK